MTPRRAAFETLYTAALGVWLGVVIMTAVAAARAFPIMGELAPTLAKYGSYTGDHSKIAAGKVVNSVFLISAMAEGLCFVAAGTALVLLTIGKHMTVLGSVLRWTTVVALGGVLGYDLMVLRPRMNANARRYWDLAESGDSTNAAIFQEAFRADHGPSQAVMALTAVLLLIAISVAAFTLIRKEPKVPLAIPVPDPEPAPAPNG
jgi:hypothetical protein